ncbi:MAG: N-acetylneuraminate synthase [Parcubacteria group bacterium]|jgi:N,N'-diacetyllegionaminate synthase|nr:N-acetylneuraminate synthase [Parcubacteria group bacterium]|tara:strand:+ start:1664 stop:2674 length:1011 start_codon:yes stop_codon:yes gene_type:complete
MKNNKTIIIAEAGVNHNGKLSLAKKLVDEVKNVGADFIKFQFFKTENIILKKTKLTQYQKKNISNNNIDQYKLLKKLELSESKISELINYANKKKIKIFFSVFDIESINFIKSFKINLFKIPSGEINNLPYLTAMGKLKSKLILSTGMANIEEIDLAIKTLIKSGTPKKNIIVMHCNTEYPSPIEDINMRSMLTIKNKFKVEIGYSDHSNSDEVPIVAVSLGAKVIEKHFTISKKLNGPDHKTSLDPKQFKKMAQNIRNTESILGSYLKKPSKSELKNIKIVRKSIVALKDIKKGEVFSSSNLTVKRPGTGISPIYWDRYIGKVSRKNFKKDSLIN